MFCVSWVVTKQYNRWKDALENFSSHQTTEYHKYCRLAANNLLKVSTNEIQPIDVVLDSRLKKEIEGNRKFIEPIIDTVVFCGRQGIALRGDKDHGSIESFDYPVHNDGNFRNLLRYRSRGGDKVLADHLLNCAQNASYISPVIQNDIIEVCNDIIVDELVSKVNSAQCFSVLADETADVSGIEQLSLGIRYLDCDRVHEDFFYSLCLYMT